MKKSLIIILLAFGLGIFAFGSYLSSQIDQEQNQLSQTEMDGRGRPILGPVRRAARNGAAETAQQKIGYAKQQVARSQVNANWLRGIGAVLFGAGVVYLAICYFGKRR